MVPPANRSRFSRRAAVSIAVVALAVAAVACGGDSSETSGPLGPPTSVRLGFFPNVTHAPALVGVAEGTFAAALGDATALETFTFDAGTEAAEALLAGSLDLTFIGPNPAINAFAQSGGEAVRIVSGSTSGGAFLVVREGITSAADLAGLTIATPSLGNTQDVALRAWLKNNGFETTVDGGGDVVVLPQKNSTTLESFINGDIDGAWVPEPWATRLVNEGGGVVLVDERDLWTETGGEFVTTHLLVRTEFLDQHPDTVAAIIEGLAAAIDSISADPAGAQADVVAQIGSITGTEPDPATVAAAFENLTFTLDPIPASLAASAADATSVGLLGEIDLTGIYALDLLNALREERGESKVVGL